MVNTIKFSQFASAGNLAINSTTVGLSAGTNAAFNNPWVFLPPGNTASRPAPSPSTNYLLRLNTDTQLYEYYDAVAAAWIQVQSGLIAGGPFVIYTADPTLPGAFDLGALTSGILKQTVFGASATPAIAVNEVDYYGPGMTGYLQSPAGFKDSLGNILFNVQYAPNAVNYLQIQNAATGGGPVFAALGTDADVEMFFLTKGTGQLVFDSQNTVPIQINSGTNYLHVTNFAFANTAVTRTVTFQDSDGTVAWLTDIPAGSPAALTKVDDTNVTLTLGGTPATALLQATSITAGWTGTLSGTRGGTGVNNGASTLTLGGNLVTSGAFASTFTMTGATNVTFPTSGTLATTSQLPTPAALTKVDDTNVTLSLGGTPATALLQGTSITAGWTGTLSGTRGGTGVNNGASTITVGGNFAMSGAFTFTGTLTGNTGVTFPTSGTLATTSQIPAGAALTKTDDTNVTLTLGGSPTTALVNAASLTLGWTGQLAVSRGGTGISSFGTGVATALGQNVTGSGGIALANGPTFVTSTVTAPSITFSTTSGVIGTTTNNDAAVGSVGEYVRSSVGTGTASLSTGTIANVTSISLTAGDWDVSGTVAFFGGATTTTSLLKGWVSITSASDPGAPNYANERPAGTPFATAPVDFTVPNLRVSIAATTTVYLSVQATFATSTCTAGGIIAARRVR